MPEPESTPPPQRTVPSWKWLLLFLPAALLLLVPLLDFAIRRFHLKLDSDTLSGLLSLWLFGALILCFRLGFLVEKWLRGPASRAFRAILFGVLLLFVNCTIALVGCATLL